MASDKKPFGRFAYAVHKNINTFVNMRANMYPLQGGEMIVLFFCAQRRFLDKRKVE